MVSGSIGANNGRLTFGGFASGLDTNAIIDALIAASERPIVLAQSKLATIQTRQASLASINTSVANLTARAAALKDASIVGAKRATVTLQNGETAKVTASASSAAAVGSFTVDVLGLATATKTQSTSAMGLAVTQNVALANGGFSTAVTTGTFTVNGATVTIDAATVLSDGADLVGANTIVAKIRDAGVGVTASVVNDADGRANLLQLTSGAAITLGSGGDTSNFLAAANLLQSPAGTTRTSTRPMAGVNTGATLQSARLATALATASGSFTINGVSISWDRTVDSLANVIARINASGAGVTATYDVTTDRLALTRTATGSSSIALADVSGNFLTATRVLAAGQTLGQNASYKINGGATQYASTNTVADAVSGITLTLIATTTTAVTVDVAPDNAALRSRISSFVEQFNSTMALLRDATKYVEKGAKGPLFGDSLVQGLAGSLREFISRQATGITGDLTSLSALGLSFGAVGAATGTTTTLSFDTAKFDAAVASNPEGVRKLLAAFSANAALDAGGAGSIASISGKPTTVTDSGKYTVVSTAAGALTVTFTPDSGATPVIYTGTITAGGTNSTIIPGVTLTAKPVLIDGQDTISITAAEEGVGKQLHEYLESVTRSGGPISARTTELTNRVADINKQIATTNDRLARKREQLIRQYAQLEVTMSRLQQQQQAIGQFQTQLSNMAKASR
jgi:flagellar hook-associated protein 2